MASMLLKASPIHLALLFFIFPILCGLMLLLGVPDSSHVQLLILSAIIGWVSYLVCLQLAAKQLQQRITHQHLSLHAFFKRHFIAMIILKHVVFPVCVYWNLTLCLSTLPITIQLILSLWLMWFAYTFTWLCVISPHKYSWSLYFTEKALYWPALAQCFYFYS